MACESHRGGPELFKAASSDLREPSGKSSPLVKVKTALSSKVFDASGFSEALEEAKKHADEEADDANARADEADSVAEAGAEDSEVRRLSFSLDFKSASTMVMPRMVG